MKGNDDTLQSNLDKYKALDKAIKMKVLEQLKLWSDVPPELFTVTPCHCVPEYYMGNPMYDGAVPTIEILVNGRNADPTRLERAQIAAHRFLNKLDKALKSPPATVFELAEAINKILSKSLGKIKIPEIDGYTEVKGGIV